MSESTLAKVEAVAECGAYVHLTETTDLWNGELCDEAEATSGAGRDTRTISCDNAFHVVIQSDPDVPSTIIGNPAKL